MFVFGELLSVSRVQYQASPETDDLAKGQFASVYPVVFMLGQPIKGPGLETVRTESSSIDVLPIREEIGSRMPMSPVVESDDHLERLGSASGPGTELQGLIPDERGTRSNHSPRQDQLGTRASTPASADQSDRAH